MRSWVRENGLTESKAPPDSSQPQPGAGTFGHLRRTAASIQNVGTPEAIGRAELNNLKSMM
jgi:hypothetical protein